MFTQYIYICTYNITNTKKHVWDTTYDLQADNSMQVLLHKTTELVTEVGSKIVTCHEAGIVCFDMTIKKQNKKYVTPWDLIKEIHVRNTKYGYTAISQCPEFLCFSNLGH